jgi:hypothetical protein
MSEYGQEVIVLGDEMHDHAGRMTGAAGGAGQDARDIASLGELWGEADQGAQIAMDAVLRILSVLSQAESGVVVNRAVVDGVTRDIGRTDAAVTDTLAGAESEMAAEALEATHEAKSKVDDADEKLGRAGERLTSLTELAEALGAILSDVRVKVGEAKHGTSGLGVIATAAETDLKEGAAAATRAGNKLTAYGQSV